MNVLLVSKMVKSVTEHQQLYNRVVQMLVRDEAPYKIIDHLCQMLDDKKKALEKYIYRDPRPMGMS